MNRKSYDEKHHWGTTGVDSRGGVNPPLPAVTKRVLSVSEIPGNGKKGHVGAAVWWWCGQGDTEVCVTRRQHIHRRGSAKERESGGCGVMEVGKGAPIRQKGGEIVPVR